MIKRVLLINPGDTRPPDMLASKVRIGLVVPLGLAYIAAVLEKEGIEVKVLDCAAEGYGQTSPYGEEIRYGLWDYEIADRIEEYHPDLVGVSCLFSNKAWDAHNVCRIAKVVNPKIITVMGGMHPTVLPEETLEDDNVDYIVKGEGEKAFLQLVRWSPKELGTLRGFSADPCNLDSLPLPARHLLPMDIYLKAESAHSGTKQRPATTMMTSRGCPGRCSFCSIRSMWGESFRMRSPENVLAEIDYLVKAYGIREIQFEDDNISANKKRAMAIFQGIIDRKYNISLSSPSGLAVFAMDEDLMDKMVEAGYYTFSFAIESGNQHVLKDLIHKKVDFTKAKRLVAHARKLGVKTKAFFILGYPGETKETMRDTINFARELQADWNLFFPATPLPGTEMMETCRKNGWLVDPNLDYRYFFFKPNIKTSDFDPDYVMALKEQVNYELNFRDNINMRLGNYDRAVEDFAEIVRLYPDLDFAKVALTHAVGFRDKRRRKENELDL